MKKKLVMKKILRYALFSILFIILLAISVYIIMLVDTHSVMKEVKDVFLGKIPYEQTENTPLSRFNTTNYVTFPTVKLKLFRYFTLHNFRDGYIWANYTVEVYDKEGNLVTGGWNIPTKWKIHNEKGKWEIVEIFEDP